MKKCPLCKEVKSDEEFYRCLSKSRGLQSRCISCQRKTTKEVRATETNAGKLTGSTREQRRLKLSALQAYGGLSPQCACCGVKEWEFLCIDHIDGNGSEHRKQIMKDHGQLIYRWLKVNGYPAGFRVLCHNCNLSLGLYGYCPHNLKSPIFSTEEIAVRCRTSEPQRMILEAMKVGLFTRQSIADHIHLNPLQVTWHLGHLKRKHKVINTSRGTWRLTENENTSI